MTHNESLETSSKSKIVNPKLEIIRIADDNLLGKNHSEQISNSSCVFQKKNRKLRSKTSEEEPDDTKTVSENETLEAFNNFLEMTPECDLESSVAQNIEPREITIDSKDKKCDSETATSSTFLCSSALACSLIPQKVQSECKTASATDIVESQEVTRNQSNLHLTTSMSSLQDSNPGSIDDSKANVLSGALLETDFVQPKKISASEAINLKSLVKLSENFKTLYIKGKYHDLTIILQGEEFKVHKDILSARSPIFAELLSQKAGERIRDTISIDHFDGYNSEIFHDFLLYVYSGNLENLSNENVCGLYYAADKYEMPELKEECIDFLKKSLSIETISDVVCLITKNEEHELLEMATIFFARNLEDIMVTDKWQQFMKEDTAKAVNFHLNALKIGYKKTIT